MEQMERMHRARARRKHALAAVCARALVCVCGVCECVSVCGVVCLCECVSV